MAPRSKLMVMIGQEPVDNLDIHIPFVIGWPDHPSRKEVSTINLDYPA